MENIKRFEDSKNITGIRTAKKSWLIIFHKVSNP
jgi:hypothetical protein